MIAWSIYGAMCAVFLSFALAPILLESDRRDYDNWQR